MPITSAGLYRVEWVWNMPKRKWDNWKIICGSCVARMYLERNAQGNIEITYDGNCLVCDNA